MYLVHVGINSNNHPLITTSSRHSSDADSSLHLQDLLSIQSFSQDVRQLIIGANIVDLRLTFFRAILLVSDLYP